MKLKSNIILINKRNLILNNSMDINETFKKLNKIIKLSVGIT